MRLKSWSSFWTILATLAGVVGAGAAVYPLFTRDQQGAFVTIPDWRKEDLHGVYVEVLSEPIILTGNWYIKRVGWWRYSSLRTGNVVGYVERKPTPSPKGKSSDWLAEHEARPLYTTMVHPLEAVRLAAQKRMHVGIDLDAIRRWAKGGTSYCEPGEFEIGIEYRWKAGLSWATTKLPICG